MAAVTEKESINVLGARAFAKELAPSYIDHVCLAGGFAPPPGSLLGEGLGAGFAWCELHCGSAVTATLLASCNPLGDFHAIDARPELLDKGRALAKDGAVRNITFHEAGIEAALGKTLPAFDYIVLNGIYSWVPLQERGLVLAFLRKFLKPGGAVYASYNARPGWNRLDPFRRIFREATRGLKADPKQRLDVAREIYAKLLEARAPAIAATGVTPASLAEIDRIPIEVIAADYANDFAEPLYVTELFSDFAAIDCVFAGPSDMAESATTLSGHEPFKSILARLPQPAGRELAKDMLRDTRFRRDVFVRGGSRMTADNRDMVMNGLAFALELPSASVRYSMKLPFGEINFDNPHARALVAVLESGPRALGELVADAHARKVEAQAVVTNVHALLVTGQIRPVYRASREAAEGAHALQAAIRVRAGTADGIGFLPSPFGTAFVVPVPDQLFIGMNKDLSADEMAEAAVEALGTKAPAMREIILTRARAFGRNAKYYATFGLTA